MWLKLHNPNEVRMREGNSFSLCQFTPRQGDTTIQLMGGYPVPRSRWGYPFPGPGRGRWGRYPLVRSDIRMGVGQGRGWGDTPPHPGQIPGQGWVPLIQVRSQDGGGGRAGVGQVPPSRSDPRMGGTPYWNSIACTCYTAGSMPLAFTQEDFLVLPYFRYGFMVVLS